MTAGIVNPERPTKGATGVAYRFLRIDPDVGAVAARGRLEHPDRRSARQLGALTRPAAQQRLVDGVARTSAT